MIDSEIWFGKLKCSLSSYILIILSSSYWREQCEISAIQHETTPAYTILQQTSWWSAGTGQPSPASVAATTTGSRGCPWNCSTFKLDLILTQASSPVDFQDRDHLAAEFPSKKAEELEGADFYKRQLRLPSGSTSPTGWWRSICRAASCQICPSSPRQTQTAPVRGLSRALQGQRERNELLCPGRGELNQRPNGKSTGWNPSVNKKPASRSTSSICWQPRVPESLSPSTPWLQLIYHLRTSSHLFPPVFLTKALQRGKAAEFSWKPPKIPKGWQKISWRINSIYPFDIILLFVCRPFAICFLSFWDPW